MEKKEVGFMLLKDVIIKEKGKFKNLESLEEEIIGKNRLAWKQVL